MITSAGKYDIVEGKSIYGTLEAFVYKVKNHIDSSFFPCVISLDMHVAFNYSQSIGSAQILRFVTEHTEASSSELC